MQLECFFDHGWTRMNTDKKRLQRELNSRIVGDDVSGDDSLKKKRHEANEHFKSRFFTANGREWTRMNLNTPAKPVPPDLWALFAYIRVHSR